MVMEVSMGGGGGEAGSAGRNFQGKEFPGVTECPQPGLGGLLWVRRRKTLLSLLSLLY